ncbi:uncharacterized protein YodC (DUF2158 family) [Bosea sp. BE125]|uniref:YodC family protein n=1 Tax=Bosea sp. BE125 TaxID=2817909 RepID=UPI002863C956|nr:DUF2158 domain-containing protein [Bosea sp. BE125]MDR6873533.1 uncharacterized protein YodC (DUF2158 family) [Bosea sp. BE125]
MANKFKIGDVVMLKSGGPPMTISSSPGSTSDLYGCRWFKGATAAQGAYIEGVLQLYTAPDAATASKK